jgi:hypothetical protein
MGKLKSRKFFVAIVTALLIVLNQGLGLNLPEESVLTLAGVAATYIFGQSMVDKEKEKKKEE